VADGLLDRGRKLAKGFVVFGQEKVGIVTESTCPTGFFQDGSVAFSAYRCHDHSLGISERGTGYVVAPAVCHPCHVCKQFGIVVVVIVLGAGISG
jgi:hypothetical protein